MIRNDKPRKVTKLVIKKIRELFISGNSSIEIGKKINLSSTTVLDYLHKLGIDPNRGRRRIVINKDDERRMLELWKGGLSGTKISKRLNIPVSTIYWHLRKYVDTTYNGKYLPYKITDSMRNKMVKLWKLGLSSSKIAKQFNVTKDAVIDNLRKEGVDTGARANIPIPTKIKLKMKDFYESGYSTIQVGKMLNVGDWVVRKYLKRMGIDTGLHYNSPNKVNKRNLWKKIIQLWNKGMGAALIAKNLGIAKPTVFYHLHKHKIKSRRKFKFDIGLSQEKYDSLKLILIKFFSMEGYDILKVADYSAPGPDMLLLDPSDNVIPVEFKAEMCTGNNVGKGLRQIISYKLNSQYGFLISTADSSNLDIPHNVKVIWSDKLYEMFPEHKNNLDVIRFVSTRVPKISN